MLRPVMNLQALLNCNDVSIAKYTKKKNVLFFPIVVNRCLFLQGKQNSGYDDVSNWPSTGTNIPRQGIFENKLCYM